MVINIAIKGGLGNQLFQYALGNYLKTKYSCSVFYDFYPLLQKEENLTPRGFLLEDIFGKITLTNKKTHDLFYSLNDNIITKIQKKIIKLITHSYYIQEQTSQTLNLNPQYNYYLDGYWQNKQYAEVLIEDLNAFKKTFLKDNAIYKSILQANESIGIHIRRGDYIENKVINAYHGACNLNYFNEAFFKIYSLKKPNSAFVFSDDIEWAKENLKLPIQTTYINGDTALPMNDLFLLSSCKHLVLSNSSFSAWASYLNTNIDKMVIAPAQWTKQLKTIETPMFEKQWIML